MNKNIFHQAYSLTIRNPLLWIFGLVLLGGFNLSLINFATLVQNQQYNVWNLFRGYIDALTANELVFVGLALLLIFAVFHLLKILFFVTVHHLVHNIENNTCRLCVHIQAKTSPYFLWWRRVVLASLVTVLLSAGVGAVFNALLTHIDSAGSGAMVLNFIFLVVIVCGIGVWNTFSAYFIVWHDMNFSSAAKASFDLITVKYKQVVEFVLVLSLIYTLAVFVGQAFINGWHQGWYGGQLAVRPVFLIAFILWTAGNNLFFHLAFQLFFDKTVRSVPAIEEAPPLAEIS